jgi:hypothetical protein
MLGTAGFGGAGFAGGCGWEASGVGSTAGTTASVERRVGSVRRSEEITGERRIDVINESAKERTARQKCPLNYGT